MQQVYEGVSPDLMGDRYREYIAEKNKKKPPGKKHELNSEVIARAEAAERAALRAEYFRVARQRHRKVAQKGPKR